MARHLPGVVWSFWKPGVTPNAWVRTTSKSQLELKLITGQHIFMSRNDARLLARRINQCLEETK